MTVNLQNKERGFTLIELIMVIVILGILSAFALPKFADFSGDAEASSIEGARGSVRSSVAIAHAACLASSACNASGATSSVTMEGTSVAMVYGYPAESALSDLAGLADYYVNTAPAANTVIAIEASDNSPCLTYVEAADATTPPVVSVTSGSDSGDGLQTNATAANETCTL